MTLMRMMKIRTRRRITTMIIITVVTMAVSIDGEGTFRRQY
jgi:hypothetical protein